MARQILIVWTLLFALGSGGQALADHGCSVKDIAGKWLFATAIGRQSFGPPFPPDSDVTALGTMNINRDGSLSGRFDLTVQDGGPVGFLPSITYWGSVVVNADCTGTLTFQTSEESSRTDSIAIVNRREIIGMSQDPANLWTYQVRRIAAGLRGRTRQYDDDD